MSVRRAAPGRWRAVDVGVTAVLTVVVLGPLLGGRGFALRGDMVFVPDQPWKAAWLGLDGAVPRAVPMDAVVWLLGLALPGDVVQKLLLAGALVVGGLGAARLADSRWGRAAAITVFLWNPWVAERLAIGQWAAVAGYALLPWLLRAGLAFRDGDRGGWSRTAVLLVLSAGCAPSMGLVAAALALAVLLGRPRLRSTLGVLVTAVVANLPWVVPALLRPDSLDAPAGQFSAFASHGESALGVLASVLSLGGIWKESIVPAERGSAFVVGCSLLLTGVGLAGALVAARRGQRRTVAALGGLAGLCVLLATLPAWSPVADLLDDASGSVPAVGILRDSARYLGPFCVLLALGVGVLVDEVVRRARPGREAMLAVAGLVVVLPVVLLPSLAWGLRGELDPVAYPREWRTTAAVMASSGEEGATVVLPWTGSYRGFAWNGHRAVLDPAPRFFPGTVLIDDRMYVDRVLPSEDSYLVRIGSALRLEPSAAAAALRRLGVGQVLVEKGNGVRAEDVPAGVLVHDGPQLRLVALGPAGPSGRGGPPRWAVLGADALTGAVALAAVALALVGRRRPGPAQRGRHLSTPTNTGRPAGPDPGRAARRRLV